MKKIFVKTIALMLVLVFGLTILSGCAVDELSLLYALCKQPDITSRESKTELTMYLTSDGLSKELKEELKPFETIVNGTKLKINQKVKSNAEKTVTKSQTDMFLDFDGIGFSATAWSDYDLSGETPGMKEIIKLPPLLTLSMPEDAAGKQYMIFDTKELLSSGSDNILSKSSKKYIDYNKNLTVNLINFIKEYSKVFDPGFPIVTRKESKIVNNELVSVYNLKLDDTSFKKLLHYTVKDAVQNELVIELVREIAFSTINISGLSYRERLNQRIEVNNSIEDFKENLPEFLETWDSIMGILKDVRILGDKGIDISYGINSEGFIVSENGSIDFAIDLKEINAAMEKYATLTGDDYIEEDSSEKGIIKLRIDFDTIHSNINKNVVVDLPALTSDNSFGFMDMFEDSLLSMLPGSSKTEDTSYENDITPPASPKVDKVVKTSKSVTGKAEAFTIITVKKDDVVLGTDIADEEGTFSVAISPVNTKCTLTVTASDFYGNESLPAQVHVD